MLLLFIAVQGNAQIRPRIKEPKTNSLIGKKPEKAEPQTSEVRQLFASVEEGMLGGAVSEFAGHFGKQVSVTVGGSESGFVSSSQAVSILQNYLSSRKPTQFSFTRWNDTIANPYATGRMTFLHRGSKQTVQVYVSLIQVDGGWVISQFNIY